MGTSEKRLQRRENSHKNTVNWLYVMQEQ